MNIHLWGILIGWFVGVGVAFFILLLLAPMGGTFIQISVLPYMIGPALLVGLLAQSICLRSHTNPQHPD